MDEGVSLSGLEHALRFAPQIHADRLLIYLLTNHCFRMILTQTNQHVEMIFLDQSLSRVNLTRILSMHRDDFKSMRSDDVCDNVSSCLVREEDQCESVERVQSGTFRPRGSGSTFRSPVLVTAF